VHHAFLDRYGDLDPPIHRLDARARILALGGALVVVVSEAGLRPVAWLLYAALLLLIIAAARIPVGFVVRRWLMASPFILLAGALMLAAPLTAPSSAGPGAGVTLAGPRIALAASVLLKATAAIVLLTLLTATGRFHRLLYGLRSLRVPGLLSTLLAFMYRYIYIMSDELQRTSRARASRTPGRIRSGRMRATAWQAGTVFVRGYDRSHRVYAAMRSRGFDGTFPQPVPPRFGWRDALAVTLVLGAFVAVRIA